MDQPLNEYNRLLAAAREVRLPTGPQPTFTEIAARFNVSLSRLEQIIDREKRRHRLTACEREVLIAYASGEIVKRISATESTADKHIANMKRKLGIHNRADATHYCIMAGWIPLGYGLSEQAKISALAEAAKAP